MSIDKRMIKDDYFCKVHCHSPLGKNEGEVTTCQLTEMKIWAKHLKTMVGH